jgi:GDP-L-fucose synthase
MIDRNSKVFLTGHNGMVGSKLLSAMRQNGYANIITASHADLDLREQSSVNAFLEKNQPHYVIHLAAKVGGINANINNPAVFLYDNLMMQANLIHGSYLNNVQKFFFLGSSCIYPRECPQPMKEEYLLTGKLEPTNEGYAIGKIAGIKLLESYHKQYSFNSVSLMPSNLYGPNDSFDLAHAHVLSSLVKRFIDAKQDGSAYVTLWGTGNARREFLHVSDLVRAILYFFENHEEPEFINIGPGNDISIKELAYTIAEKINYAGEIRWDTSKPDGMMRKCMDVSKMKSYGFETSISLSKGIDEVINSYQDQKTKNQKTN